MTNAAADILLRQLRGLVETRAFAAYEVADTPEQGLALMLAASSALSLRRIADALDRIERAMPLAPP